VINLIIKGVELYTGEKVVLGENFLIEDFDRIAMWKFDMPQPDDLEELTNSAYEIERLKMRIEKTSEVFTKCYVKYIGQTRVTINRRYMIYVNGYNEQISNIRKVYEATKETLLGGA